MNPYADLEQLLFKGFILEKLSFNGFDFVLKSLTDQEIERVQERTPSSHPAKDIYYDCWFVAYSILQINGVYFLDDREDKLNKLFSALIKWPRKALARIIYKCLAFNKRIAESYKKFEAYCYEPQSRVFWKAYQSITLNSRAVTGIKGTEDMPLSSVQVQWLAYNRAEDEKQTFETTWSYVRWGGAFLNQKAAQKVEEEVKSQKDQEDEYKRQVMAKARGEINGDILARPPGSASKQDELSKLLYDLDIVINNKKDNHELAMDKAREDAIANYRAFKLNEKNLKEQAIKNRVDYKSDNKDHPFDIYDQVKLADVEDANSRKSLISSVLGISIKELESIDKEYEIQTSEIENFYPVSNLSRSTILPININPGNYSGQITRGGVPQNSRNQEE
ncbi:hypothetical protein EBS02_09845 [bacterium]|nr:hypothetical protein [bacterium]